MQNVLNFLTIRRLLFVGLGAFLAVRGARIHDWVAVGFGLCVAGYGWWVRG
jgi:hypothetical protein